MSDKTNRRKARRAVQALLTEEHAAELRASRRAKADLMRVLEQWVLQGSELGITRSGMKNVAEFRAALNMILARLDSSPKSSEEWAVIYEHLKDAMLYARELTGVFKEFEQAMETKL